ncbi:gamma-glutamylcyclotransferase family protein, partial [Acinetobacter sp.]|uniref:gamma-glutamylcyclotransferase family protein n=1 Tax=Acinetobacter sp. TaxID=472 RepID=UPI0039821523
MCHVSKNIRGDSIRHIAFSGTGNRIWGEIYEIKEDMVGAVDHLEGHPELYTRTEIL